MKEKLLAYSADVMKEMNKVSWPTKDELRDSTIIVAAVCGILSIFVFGIDSLLSFLVNKIF